MKKLGLIILELIMLAGCGSQPAVADTQESDVAGRWQFIDGADITFAKDHTVEMANKDSGDWATGIWAIRGETEIAAALGDSERAAFVIHLYWQRMNMNGKITTGSIEQAFICSWIERGRSIYAIIGFPGSGDKPETRILKRI